jgi:subtilisin family serine protease
MTHLARQLFLHRQTKRLLAIIFAAAITVGPFLSLSLSSDVLAGQPETVSTATPAPAARAGEVLVKIKGETKPVIIKLSAEQDVRSVVNDIGQRSDVDYVEPNYIYELSAFDPNDSLYSGQWYLRQIGLPVAWEKSTGSPDVVVAVLDSGVDINHPDLKENIWRNPGEVDNDRIDNDNNGFTDDVHGWDFIEWSSDPRPSAVPPYSRTALHHGTLVAGLIGAVGNNQVGVAGVTWRTKIMPLRVLDRQGQGDVEQVAQAVDYAVKNGANVINLSFVGSGFSQRLYDSLRAAHTAGVVIVVAAGNTADHTSGGDLDVSLLYPICYDATDVSGENWILGVTATDTLDQRASFANVGSLCVDIAAPGVNITSTQVFDPGINLHDAYGGPWQGTSLAAPLVAGAAALLKSAERNLTNQDIIKRLTSTTDDITTLNQKLGNKLGRGRLNVGKALNATNSNSPSSSPSTSLGQIITVPIGLWSTDYKIMTASGAVSRTLSIPTSQFRSGGSVAVSENARLNPQNGAVRLSAILRGDQLIVLGEGPYGQGRIRTYDIAGNLVSTWLAFGAKYTGGVEVAAGDILGTGEGLIVVVPQQGGPQVRLFNRQGKVINQFFAFDQSLRGRFDVAVSNVAGDSKEEIIISSLDNPGLIRIFSGVGELMAEWLAFPENKAGVRVAAGDLDGDGVGEIVAAPVRGRDVRILNFQGNKISQFPVFPVGFRGGTQLSVGDVNSDGIGEIVVTPASLGGPQVRVIDNHARVIGQFFAYNRLWRGGLGVAVLR